MSLAVTQHSWRIALWRLPLPIFARHAGAVGFTLVSFLLVPVLLLLLLCPTASLLQQDPSFKLVYVQSTNSKQKYAVQLDADALMQAAAAKAPGHAFLALSAEAAAAQLDSPLPTMLAPEPQAPAAATAAVPEAIDTAGAAVCPSEHLTAVAARLWPPESFATAAVKCAAAQILLCAPQRTRQLGYLDYMVTEQLGTHPNKFLSDAGVTVPCVSGR